MKKSKRTFGKILMTLMIIFFYLPILYMIIFSFNSGKSLTAYRFFPALVSAYDGIRRYDGGTLYNL